MDLEALAHLGEFLSGVVVIVSLVYVAVQVRQNTRAQRTDTYARALDRIAQIQARLSEDGQLTEILHRGLVDLGRLSATERIQFTWIFYEMFGAFEFIYHQNRSTALPDEVWPRWSATLLWWLAFPGVRSWWDARPTPFTPSFTAFVEASRTDTPPDPEAHRRWVQFLAGEAE
jgi:hypothetical protein